MQHKKLKLSAMLLLVIGLNGLQAQQSIPTTGGNASGTGGSVSYSFGQLFYSTMPGSNGMVMQGVQQPFEISVISGLPESEGIHHMISAYPNPAKDLLFLKVEDLEGKKLIYHLYDLQGKLLENKQLTDGQTQIPVKNLAPGTYFLKVIQGKSEIKTFKIIKN